jgi:topoisomerase-4 subunit A
MAKEISIDIDDLGGEDITTLKGMYKEYFLDYASYVILERAVPHINDGLKPVQRRILHAMKEMDDGRFNKVANIIGQTMQYHPHGDAAIGAALVNMGQKDLLIDTQGNWGDTRTGDGAAAARYIEARLTKFALEVAFNPQTTDWQISYDGRKNEPITLPMKFPLVVAQGVEGIAVGLSTKILPHNFIEILKASIKLLEGKKTKLFPDFDTGGYIDVSEYNDGKRGGKVKIRAKIQQVDKNNLAIVELPYGVTTNTLIDSILKANDKGQIKIKKVVDNTAKDVEIAIELQPGVSPDLTIDALYAFTNCEISASPNACIIVDNKPLFLSISDILEMSTFMTKKLLGIELEIKKGELQEKWHLASLEKIFIEKRIYRDIEEAESWEAVLKIIDKGLKKYVATPSDMPVASDGRLLLMRDITDEDIAKLTEIKIKRISKYNSFKADELLQRLEDDLKQVQHDLDNLTDFTIAYFQNLLDKYGKGRERKTEIMSMETIEIQQVVANNAKLYVDKAEGFVGLGMKKDEFVCDCSDIDDVIAFTKEGKFKVVRVADKVFIGKNIVHVDVWKKGDDRTTYNLVYLDAKSGKAMAKRFNVTAITRDKEYDLTKGSKGSKMLYFSAQPNGESEVLNVQLTPGCAAKKKMFDFDFGELAIKGRGSQGNILTKYPVKKITQLELGKSSLGAIKVWIDEVSGRLNTDERGQFLGGFDTGSQILAIYNDGSYEVNELDLNKRYEQKSLFTICKYNEGDSINVLYYEGEKGWTMAKRFVLETNSHNQKYTFISEASGSKLYFANVGEIAKINISYKEGKESLEKELDLIDFIDIKGWKAMGNKVGDFKVSKVKLLEEAEVVDEDKDEDSNEKIETKSEDKKPKKKHKEDSDFVQGDLFGGSDDDNKSDGIKPGDTIDFDL